MLGILVCGSGLGMNMTANKHKNIELHYVLMLNLQNYQDCITMQISLHWAQDYYQKKML